MTTQTQTLRRAGAAILILSLIIGGSALLSGPSVNEGQVTTGFLPFSLTPISSGQSWVFQAGDGYCYGELLSNGMSYSGTPISIDNYRVPEDQSTDIGEVQIGRYTEDIDDGGVVTNDGWRVEVISTKSFSCGRPIGAPGWRTYDQDEIVSIIYRVSVDIPEDRITADVSNVNQPRLGNEPVDSISFTVEVENDWQPVYVETITVDAFGQQHTVEYDDVLTAGTERIPVTVSGPIDRGVEHTVQASFENPALVQTSLSGKGDTNGNMMTIESWSRTQPDYQWCDIQTLDNSRNCERQQGGDMIQWHTYNWEWPLNSFQSEQDTVYIEQDTDGDGIPDREDETPEGEFGAIDTVLSVPAGLLEQAVRFITGVLPV